MRSRGIFVSIIIQNLAQLKKMFEKEWESIVGNCDELLYLGGNEKSTHEYISSLMGKETIDLETHGESKGRGGSYSSNYQLSGRELLCADEVRRLDNKYAILFIRGEYPICDRKFDITKHKNYKYIIGEPYRYGENKNRLFDYDFSRFDREKIIPNKEFIIYDEKESLELARSICKEEITYSDELTAKISP